MVANVASANGSTGSGSSALTPQQAQERRAAKRRAAQSKRLRSLVSRFHGCLSMLGQGSQRLLRLRAGIGGPALSAAGTAKELHVSTGRESRLENQALSALQVVGSSGCSAGGAQVIQVASDHHLVGSIAQVTPSIASGSSTPSAATATPKRSTKAASATKPQQRRRAKATKPRGAASGPLSTRPIERASTESHGTPTWAIALTLLALGLALVSMPLVQAARERKGRKAAVAGAGAGSGSGDAPLVAAAAAAAAAKSKDKPSKAERREERKAAKQAKAEKRENGKPADEPAKDAAPAGDQPAAGPKAEDLAKDAAAAAPVAAAAAAASHARSDAAKDASAKQDAPSNGHAPAAEGQAGSEEPKPQPILPATPAAPEIKPAPGTTRGRPRERWLRENAPKAARSAAKALGRGLRRGKH